jgi:inosine/xanthosine triphosphatase
MRVAVGSTNPVKRRATEAALSTVAVRSVESVAVSSGVSEQPFGPAEAIEGARTRARNALDSGAFDLGVGLEGGVAEVEGVDGLFLTMWAAVTDGERSGLGAGPRLRLPESVAARVRAGEELGPVMDDVLGTDDVAEKQGAAGVLTAGIIDREEALAAALGPFATDRYE